jgi:2-keto-4-pentenoate hydratase/2-oxohepta-3-ene-1,7-dioic acid hydratase in catechol pathway
MKIITFQTSDGPQLGILQKDLVYEAPISIESFYQDGLTNLPNLEKHITTSNRYWKLKDLTLSPVVPNPGKILCVGLNYRQHSKESGMAEPSYPVLFSKFNNALCGAGETIPISPAWKEIDYEAELAVVIGRKTAYVPESEALDHILGYCCANDLSERERQFRSGQWLLGKTLDGFCPLGPTLVTTDEIPDPNNLWIRGWYNGELQQNSTTADMIFSVAKIIAYASQHMTLFSGDVILTGTPEGVIFGTDEKNYMKPGDTFVVEIENLGRLENQLVQANR